MAGSNSYTQTKEILEKALKTKIKIGLKSNIDKWLGLDDKITMEDIYIKKYIERMNVLEIPLQSILDYIKPFVIETSEAELRERLMPRELGSLTTDEDLLRIIKKKTETSIDLFLKSIIGQINNWNSKLIDFIVSPENNLEKLEAIFYQTKLLQSSFEVKGIRLVEDSIYLSYEKNTPYHETDKNFAIYSEESLKRRLESNRTELESLLIQQLKTKEFNFKKRTKELKEDRTFMIECEKIIKIKLWALELATTVTTELNYWISAKNELNTLRNLTEKDVANMFFKRTKPVQLENEMWLVTRSQYADLELLNSHQYKFKNDLWDLPQVRIDGKNLKQVNMYSLRSYELEKMKLERLETILEDLNCEEWQKKDLIDKFKETEEFWNGASDAS